MEARVQIVSILACGLLLFVVFELVRRKRLMERYALLWMFCTTVMLAIAVWKDLLEQFAAAIGICYAPSALFAVALATVLVLLLHFSIVVSRLADQNKVHAQRLAILQTRVDELEAPVAPARAAYDEADAAPVTAGR